MGTRRRAVHPQARLQAEIGRTPHHAAMKSAIALVVSRMLARSVRSLAEWLPNPPLTVDQLRLLAVDNVVSTHAAHEGRTLEGIGIRPTNLLAVLPSYLVRYRPRGQFDSKRTT